MDQAKRVLVICRSAAAGGPRAREAVDLALAFGAFDQQVSLLFSGDGVLNLMAGQSADGTRSMERLLGALPDYGITPLLADADALAVHGITRAALVPGCRILDEHGIAELNDTHDIVLMT